MKVVSTDKTLRAVNLLEMLENHVFRGIMRRLKL